MRRDVVVVLVQYDQDCDDEILAIHEQIQLIGEHVVAVKAVFGAEKGTVGQQLGSAPNRFQPKRVIGT